MVNSIDDIFAQISLLESRIGIFSNRVCDNICREKALQSMWFEHLLPLELKATDGSVLCVEQTGYWNHGPGPDFLNAVVRWENGTLSQGDIEFHIYAKDWFNHHHHQNPLYSNVILNISLFGEDPVLHTAKGSVKSVELFNQIDKRLLEIFNNRAISNDNLDLSTSRPGKCSLSFNQKTPQQIEKVLEEAGLLRLHRKALSLYNQRKNDGDQQTLWENLAVCLGFSENKIPFRALARVVPYSMIEPLPQIQRDAFLFGAAGFLPKQEISSFPIESRKYLNILWNYWWNNPLSSELQNNYVRGWNFVSIRPCNHPHRRIGALCSFADGLKTCLMQLDKENPMRCYWMLTECSHHHFDHFYTIYSRKKNNKIRLVGDSRAKQILWNCFIPWILSSNPNWCPDWRKFPSEPDNIRTKRTIDRLFATKKNAILKLNGLARQGLIELFESFCLAVKNDCERCRMPEILSQKYAAEPDT